MRELHVGIDPRGGDATGAAWVTTSGQIEHHTVTGRAKQFRSAHPNAGVGAVMAILHTRYATQGSAENQLNNHPIRSGRFIGVHNGHISNDSEIFATVPFKRNGQVDSESIIALIRHAHMKGTHPAKELERLDGRAAVAWFDTQAKHPVLHLARGSASPLIVAMTEKGSTVFASTEMALLQAMKAVGMIPFTVYTVGEGTYLKFTRTRLVETTTFTLPKRTYFGYAPDQGKGKPAPAKTKAVVKAAAKPKAKAVKVKSPVKAYDSNVYTQVWDEIEPAHSLHDLSTDMGPYGNDPDLWPDWTWDNDDMLHLSLKDSNRAWTEF
jgi:asparagine synthetase B (glutamine-hydrolysing)